MNTKRQHTALLCLLAGWLAFGPIAHAQDAYTGKRAETYCQRAFSFLQTFYGLVADLSTESDVLDAYLLSVTEHYVDPQAVFIPDFVPHSEKSNVVSFSNYVFALKSAYQHPNPHSTPVMPVFSISDPQFLDIHYTEGRQGVTVNLSYAIELSYGGQCVYRGHSQSVVVFPDLVDIAGYRVRQISRIDGGTVVYPLKDEQLSQVPAQEPAPETDTIPAQPVLTMVELAASAFKDIPFNRLYHDAEFGIIYGRELETDASKEAGNHSNTGVTTLPTPVKGEYYRIMRNDSTGIYFQYPTDTQTTSITCICEEYQTANRTLNLNFSLLKREHGSWDLDQLAARLTYPRTYTQTLDLQQVSNKSNPVITFQGKMAYGVETLAYDFDGYSKPIRRVVITGFPDLHSHTVKFNTNSDRGVRTVERTYRWYKSFPDWLNNSQKDAN